MDMDERPKTQENLLGMLNSGPDRDFIIKNKKSPAHPVEKKSSNYEVTNEDKGI